MEKLCFAGVLVLSVSFLVGLVTAQVMRLNKRGDEAAQQWTADEILKREG